MDRALTVLRKRGEMLPALQYFNYASQLHIPARWRLGNQLIKMLIILLLIRSPLFCFLSPYGHVPWSN